MIAYDPRLKLSKHFSLEEMTRTENRDLIDRNHNEAMAYYDKLANLCNYVLEPVKELVGVPMIVTSGFRCIMLNTAIGGSHTSQHCHGEAADTVYSGGRSLKDIYNEIAWSDVVYSQCIFEFGQWIHIGLIDQMNYPGRVGQKLIASRVNGMTIYNEIKEPLK
jgi:hypothetical protein